MERMGNGPFVFEVMDVETTDDGGMRAHVRMTPTAAQSLTIARVLDAVRRIEEATGRRPARALIPAGSIDMFDRADVDGVRILTSELVEPGEIYVCVSEGSART